MDGESTQKSQAQQGASPFDIIKPNGRSWPRVRQLITTKHPIDRIVSSNVSLHNTDRKMLALSEEMPIRLYNPVIYTQKVMPQTLHLVWRWHRLPGVKNLTTIPVLNQVRKCSWKRSNRWLLMRKMYLLIWDEWLKTQNWPRNLDLGYIQTKNPHAPR